MFVRTIIIVESDFTFIAQFLEREYLAFFAIATFYSTCVRAYAHII